jgi:hypothetical protein
MFLKNPKTKRRFHQDVNILKFFVVLLIAFSATIKFVIPCGSDVVLFSGLTFMPPLIARFSTRFLFCFIVGLAIAAQMCGFSVFSTFGLPTITASLCWVFCFHNKRSFFTSFALRVLIPVLCILLFVFHPVGASAFWYVGYWLIPIVLLFIERRTIHSFRIIHVALTSALSAHAVGSVIWLYTMPSTPQFWLHLIPVVAIERVVVTLGMLGVYSLIKFVENHVQNCVKQVDKKIVRYCRM